MATRKIVAIVSLLALAIAGSVAVSLLVTRVKPVAAPSKTSRPFSDSDAFHDWLHSQLKVTDTQETAIMPVEQAFQARKKEHIGRIHDLNGQLAQAILKDEDDSPRIQQILTEIHAAQGELQQLTIRHIFEMKQYLEPGQYRLLLKHAAGALAPGEPAAQE